MEANINWLYKEGKWIKYSEKAVMPVKAHSTDGAYDLSCVEDFSCAAGQTIQVKTGVGIDWHTYPNGRQALLLPRSGLAFNHGITIVNSPGLIDYGYTGEISVLMHMLYNHVTPNDWVDFKVGDRIAQLMFVDSFSPLLPEFISPAEITKTERGDNGFGSTGVR